MNEKPSVTFSNEHLIDPATRADKRPPEPVERWEPIDEPTQLERIIAAQFRRGLPVPLSVNEQQAMLKMSIEQRCDYVAKLAVFTARKTVEWIKKTESK